MMNPFTRLTKGNRLAMAIMAMLVLGRPLTTQAETITEDFEKVTLTDAEGNPVANSWSFGYGLSNGWKIVGGNIFGSAGSANYGLWSTGNESNKSLEASYSASNSASVFIPAKLDGTVTFWARKTSSSSSTKGTITFFEANEDGTVTTNKLYSNNALTTTWTQYTFEVEGKYVALNMVRAAIDDFAAEVYEEGASQKAWSITAFAADQASVTTDMEGKYTATFTATVHNKGNADLTADDAATVSLLDDKKQVVATSEPVVLAAGQTADVVLTYTGSINGDGTVAFYVKENLDGKEFVKAANLNVLLFGPRFSIDAADGELQDFGFLSEGADSAKTFSVTNSGNFALTVSVTVPDGFTAGKLSVAPGETLPLSVSIDTNTPGLKSGDLVIRSNGVNAAPVTLPLKGFVADASKLLITFDDNQLPEGWKQGACPWTFADGHATGKYDFTQRSNSEMSSPMLAVDEGDCLYMLIMGSGIFPEFSVFYSTDEGENWTEKKFDDEVVRDRYELLTLSGLPVGKCLLRLVGYNVCLDAVCGLQLYEEKPDETITDVALTTTATARQQHAYTLQGQRAGQLRKGQLYIIEGKKTMK